MPLFTILCHCSTSLSNSMPMLYTSSPYFAITTLSRRISTFCHCQTSLCYSLAVRNLSSPYLAITTLRCSLLRHADAEPYHALLIPCDAAPCLSYTSPFRALLMLFTTLPCHCSTNPLSSIAVPLITYYASAVMSRHVYLPKPAFLHAPMPLYAP